jgi:adenylate kinase
MIIVLLGPPGAGKGTQGERLAARLGVPKIATGDVLRAAVRDGTPLGLEAKAAMDRGDLVPDAVIMGIMKEALASPSANGVVLDGVVRTTPGRRLADACRYRPCGRAVLLFDIDEEELVRASAAGPRAMCASVRSSAASQARRARSTAKSARSCVARTRAEPFASAWVYSEQTAGHRLVREARRKHRALDALGTLEEVEGACCRLSDCPQA